MQRTRFGLDFLASLALLWGTMAVAQIPPGPLKITVDWNAGVNGGAPLPLKTTPTLQVVVNPLLRRGSPIHDAAWKSLADLGAEDVRFVPWHPYPRLVVAELSEPTAHSTSWDFSLINPLVADFMHATEGHSVIPNFSTIPAWMYESDRPNSVPADPNQVYWNYTQGKQLRDPSRKELADYYERLVSWYTKGGFTDELGKRHESGLHYQWPWWEVFNEIDVEHQPSPAEYTKSYDAIVSRLHALDPGMKFVGLALAFPERDPNMLEYFLNPANHASGVPLDMISYHFYATPTKQQTVEDWQYSFFDQADKFLVAVRYIDAMRRRLSPATKVDLDEVGSILPTDWHPDTPYDPGSPIPPVYWQASGALYAYICIEAAKLGIDVVGESQLVGFPSQFPSVTMVDWTTGAPNARMEVLRLLHDATRSGGTLPRTRILGTDVEAQALEGSGKRRLLLVNKRNRPIEVILPGDFLAGTLTEVDLTEPKAHAQPLASVNVSLPPFAVAVAESK